tara:strand:+ start:260 stop:2092 length:1833 start_codon:yes stop_codon:yes gene_type:complete
MCGGGGDIIDAITDPVTIVAAVAAGFLAPGPGFSIGAALLAGGSVAATAALAPTPDLPSLTVGADQVTQGRNVTVRQPVAPWKVCYGTARVGGIYVHLASTNSNEFLHAFAVFTCHEINAFKKLFLDDTVLTVGTSPFTNSGNDGNGIGRFTVTSGDFYNSDGSSLRVKFHNGTTSQAADADGVSDLSEWTTNHRLRGRAYNYIRYRFDSDTYPNGLPNMSVEIEGKKVFDPRNSSTSFSNNPALCIRDFLTDTDYGLKITTAEINDSATHHGGFAYAAARCEDTINSNNRYECNGIFDLSQSPKQILDQLLTSCSGKLIYQNGKFNLYVGFHNTPSITLTNEDFIEPIQMVTKLGRKDIFNRVAGTFYDASNKFIVQEFTPIASNQYKTEDNNEEITADVEFTMTTSATKARELALIELLKARQQIVMSCTTSLKQGMQIQCGDFVNVTNSRLGFTNKPFEVQEWNLSSSDVEGAPQLVCTMVLREADPNVFTNSVLSNIDTSKEISTDPNPDSSLSAANTATAPSALTLTDLTGGEVEAVWTLTANLSQVQLEFKLSTDTNYTEQLMSGHNRRFTIRGLTAGQTYNFRIKSINSVGTSSSYATANITL